MATKLAQDALVKCVLATDKKSGAQILVRGDLVKFDLEGARPIDVPPDWGILHDPLGVELDPCDMRIGPYRLTHRPAVVIDQRLRRICEAYFGYGVQVLEGTIEIPVGPWNDLGRITHIYYARYGKEDGLFHHPIKRDAPPALLQQNRRGCYRLSLPGGCLVDSHGFVWP